MTKRQLDTLYATRARNIEIALAAIESGVLYDAVAALKNAMHVEQLRDGEPHYACCGSLEPDPTRTQYIVEQVRRQRRANR